MRSSTVLKHRALELQPCLRVSGHQIRGRIILAWLGRIRGQCNCVRETALSSNTRIYRSAVCCE